MTDPARPGALPGHELRSLLYHAAPGRPVGWGWRQKPDEYNARRPDEPHAGAAGPISRVAGAWERLCRDPAPDVAAGRPSSGQAATADGIPWRRSASDSDPQIALWAGTPLFARSKVSGGGVSLPHRLGGLERGGSL
jgi:hypothetical protein